MDTRSAVDSLSVSLSRRCWCSASRRTPAHSRRPYLGRRDDFPFTYEVLQNNLTEKTFIRGDETIVRTTGALKIRLVNTDSGESIVRNISGPVELTYHADGSVTQVANGPSFTVLEDDVERGGLPVGAVITYGRVVSRFEEGTPGGPLSGFSVVSVSGRYESVCSTLDED